MTETRGQPRELTPLVTVVIPTYNRAQLLPRAIHSVLNQNLTAFELIVVDDGSTDDTPSAVARFDDSRLHYYRTEQVGAAAARNAGARRGRGAVLTFLDSDDEAFPDWLEAMMNAFGSEDADVVCCGYSERNERGEEARVVLPRPLGPVLGNLHGLFTKAGVYAMRRRVFEVVGGFAPNLPAAQHTELAMRFVKARKQEHWEVACIDRPLLAINLHSGPRIRTDPRAKRDAALYLLTHHEDLLALESERMAASFSIAGVESLRLGDRSEGVRLLRAAVQRQPTNLKTWLRWLVAMSPAWRYYAQKDE